MRRNKTGELLGIDLSGELAALVTLLLEGARDGRSRLVRHSDGRVLTYERLFSRFDVAWLRCGVDFQFRDIRAKAATDTGDLAD